MNTILEGNFFNPTQGNLSFEEVVEEIFKFIQKKPNYNYEIIVGCDSSSETEPTFPLAVVVWRKGGGGRFFLKKVKYHLFKKIKKQNWKKRILQEVMLSCELALVLKQKLSQKLSSYPFSWQFRYIHADIGESGATREMIKEIVGFIQGNGFEAKIKPEAFVANAVADRYC